MASQGSGARARAVDLVGFDVVDVEVMLNSAYVYITLERDGERREVCVDLILAAALRNLLDTRLSEAKQRP